MVDKMEIATTTVIRFIALILILIGGRNYIIQSSNKEGWLKPRFFIKIRECKLRGNSEKGPGRKGSK
jgi:hypothetical protein